jgi:hypothetical protein
LPTPREVFPYRKPEVSKIYLADSSEEVLRTSGSYITDLLSSLPMLSDNIAFMEKIVKIQCMSSKFIVKHTKHHGLTPLTAKMVGGFLRP